MSILALILMIFFMIVCVLLILMVAIQDEKQEGLGSIFGGKSGSTFGAETASVVVKFTTILAVIFFVLALGLCFLNKRSKNNSDSIEERLKNTQGVEATVDNAQESTSVENSASDASVVSESV